MRVLLNVAAVDYNSNAGSKLSNTHLNLMCAHDRLGLVDRCLDLTQAIFRLEVPVGEEDIDHERLVDVELEVANLLQVVDAAMEGRRKCDAGYDNGASRSKRWHAKRGLNAAALTRGRRGRRGAAAAAAA